MKCPIDATDLSMTDRNGIEIDYCPQCRGVWLDRGELDKIIDRSSDNQLSQDAGTVKEQPRNYGPQINHRDHDSKYDDHHYGKKRKKEGFFSDLFDF